MYVGVDIVENKRIEKILKSKGDRFLEKIFTIEEVNHIASKNYKTETVAGLYAAKEAVSKSLKTGIGKITWKEIKILHDKNGAPFISIDPRSLAKLSIDKTSFDISISHEKNYSLAFVIRY